jgi:hypothetical protein
LKNYECVEVKHHKDAGKKIEEYERNDWHLHTYQTAGMGAGPMSYIVNHYLLLKGISEPGVANRTVRSSEADKITDCCSTTQRYTVDIAQGRLLTACCSVVS